MTETRATFGELIKGIGVRFGARKKRRPKRNGKQKRSIRYSTYG